MGCHFGPAESHTTGRRTSVAMRAVTALTGHFGIEIDPLRLDAAERAELGRWIEFYRCERDWLLDGHAYRLDHPDESIVASLFLARDGGRALVMVAKLDTSADAVPAPLPLAALANGVTYRVRCLTPLDGLGAGVKRSTAFLDGAPLEVPGEALMAAGLTLPLMPPGSACLYSLERCAGGLS
jgi:alpha-galactosidase